MTVEIKLINPSELADKLRISPTTLWRWRKERLIPPALDLGSRVIRWRATDIDAWLEKINKDGGF